MIVAIFIFALSGAAIAVGVVYAAINLVKADIGLKRFEKSYINRKQITLEEIIQTCKAIQNADDNDNQIQLLRELGELRKWIENGY